MPNRIRAGALTALAAAALTTATVLAAPAGSAAPKHRAPAFLSASQLPPHPSSSWTAGKVTDGVPIELRFCLDDVFPGYDSRYRDFYTDLDTTARQLTIVTGSAGKAKALAGRMNKEIRSCAARAEQGNPEVEAYYRGYGTIPVEEGARVHGLLTETAWGAQDVRLMSVGRDGRTVTVVDWSQMGDFGDAPVRAFKKTTTTAVNKLY
ncbi:hypothetical protein ADL00_18240 [Streptomyces sp. AS58]|uniref:hypothetical protein n=1 Tax=Streptomyces sp. AS58 TaxID=1519489 RepID=UPI0006AE3E7E|nr:hypothetical protein [Streptomyces sp. AS58]KOV65965.1 hypothetical protein ADL00_18240 [Streptomyces sp. AS58]